MGTLIAKPTNRAINNIFLVPELKLLETTQANWLKLETPATSTIKDNENHKNAEPITVYITKYFTALILFNLEPCSIVYTNKGRSIASKEIKNTKTSLTKKQTHNNRIIKSKN